MILKSRFPLKPNFYIYAYFSLKNLFNKKFYFVKAEAAAEAAIRREPEGSDTDGSPDFPSAGR
jgi:hypothetical protein